MSFTPDTIFISEEMIKAFSSISSTVHQLTCCTISIKHNFILDFQLPNGLDFVNTFKDNILGSLTSIINTPHSLNIILPNISHDFIYNRCIGLKATMLNLTNHQACSGVTPCSFPWGIRSPLYNPANFTRNNLTCLLYLISAVFSISHLAYYMALIGMLVTLLSSNRLPLYLLSLILQARGVGAANIALLNILISSIGWFIYINIMAIYDIFYKNIQVRHVYQTLVTNGRINYTFLRERLFLGLLFAFVINIGVLFSTCFGFFTIPFLNEDNRITAIVASYIISILGSSGWLYATRPEILGYNINSILLSYIRAFCESVAFNALSYANFIIWSLLIPATTTYVITFLICLVCYILFAFFQIMLETNLDHIFIYGLLYNLIFTCLSMSSSGLYFLMDIPNMSLLLKILLMGICQFIVILLPLEVYRFPSPSIILGGSENNNTLLGHLIGRERANNRIVRHLIAMLYQLILFFCFAIGTFIAIGFTGLGS